MKLTSEVLARHLNCFAARDLDGLMADYAAEALFFSPEGTLRGPEAIRGIFEKLFIEFGKPGASTVSKLRQVEGGYVYLVWTAETADNSYELVSDTFVVRNGSIQMHAFTAKVHPKSDAASTGQPGVRFRARRPYMSEERNESNLVYPLKVPTKDAPASSSLLGSRN